MLISAWARRAVMLWSLLPPLGLYLVERWFLGTHMVGTLLGDRLFGYASEGFHGQPHGLMPSPPGTVWDFVNPAGFFSSLSTWAGAAVGVALIFGVIQVRYRRTEL
jgi:hypothetical protein